MTNERRQPVTLQSGKSAPCLTRLGAVLARRCHAALDLIAPVGYEDVTGFHYGEKIVQWFVKLAGQLEIPSWCSWAGQDSTLLTPWALVAAKRGTQPLFFGEQVSAACLPPCNLFWKNAAFLGN